MNLEVKKALIEAVRKLIALAEECVDEGREFDDWEWDGLSVDLNNAIGDCERAIMLVEIADDAPSHG